MTGESLENAAWRRCSGVILTNDADRPTGISRVYAPRLLFFCRLNRFSFLHGSTDNARRRNVGTRCIWPVREVEFFLSAVIGKLNKITLLLNGFLYYYLIDSLTRFLFFNLLLLI